jgi:hypothetical protein
VPLPSLKPTSGPYHFPSHPAFGEASVVKISVPSCLRLAGSGNPTDVGNKPAEDSSQEVLFGGTELSPVPDVPVAPVETLLDDLPGEEGGRQPPQQATVSADSDESEFVIYLEFPDQARPRMTYRVYHRMPVSLLYRAIASRILDCEDNQIRIYVGDQCLLHCGTISDRYYPGLPDVPTVFISPDCTVHVRRVVMNSGDSDSIPLPPTIPIENAITDALPGGPRRVSTRVPVPRGGNLPHTTATSSISPTSKGSMVL